MKIRGTVWIALILVALLGQPCLAKKLTPDDHTLKRPISLTYDFSIQGGKNGGTQGTCTFDVRPPKTVSVKGQVSFKDDKGQAKSESFQGDYTSTAQAAVFIDMLKSLNFGSLSDPKMTDGTLLTRVVMITNFASEVSLAATIMTVKYDLKPGQYQDPSSADPKDKVTVTEESILSTPVWTVRTKLGTTTFTVSVRKDNGLPYFYEMNSRDSDGPRKVTVKIRYARV